MKRLIKKSLICGSVLFVLNLLYTLANLDQAYSLITLFFLPGLMYGYALCDFSQTSFTFKKVIFLLLSVVLYIGVAWIHYQSVESGAILLDLIVSILGAVVLYFAYYLFVDKAIQLKKGLLFVSAGALITSLPMVFGIYLLYLGNRLTGFEFPLIMSIFILWQPMFGWVIEKCRK